jgi:hypothetical protein
MGHPRFSIFLVGRRPMGNQGLDLRPSRRGGVSPAERVMLLQSRQITPQGLLPAACSLRVLAKSCNPMQNPFPSPRFTLEWTAWKAESVLLAAFRKFGGISAGGSVHVLVTADSLSGSWTYTRELVTGLVTRGVRVTLVSFGEIPLPDQTSWMDHLHGLDYRPTAFRLEWMHEAEEDLPESSAFLAALVRELRPDVPSSEPVLLRQPAGRCAPRGDGPRRSDHQVPGRSQSRPAAERSLNVVSQHGASGLAGADAVVAPSAWMLDRISACYGRPRRAEVIYPGRNPIFFNPYVSKDDCVLAVGRMVDAGKQVFLLTQQPIRFRSAS